MNIHLPLIPFSTNKNLFVALCVALSLVILPSEAVQSQSGCHPSYDPCVPIASDVDCAGGGGDGPVFVKGPIRVIGPDVYRLDRDGDAIACEK